MDKSCLAPFVKSRSDCMICNGERDSQFLKNKTAKSLEGAAYSYTKALWLDLQVNDPKSTVRKIQHQLRW